MQTLQPAQHRNHCRQQLEAQMRAQLSEVTQDIPEDETRAIYQFYAAQYLAFVPYLHAAKGTLVALREWHDAGIDINAPLVGGELDGATPLSVAIQENQLETVRYYREIGVDFYQPIKFSNKSTNYLYVAGLHCNIVMLRELIDYAISDQQLASQLDHVVVVGDGKDLGAKTPYQRLVLRLGHELQTYHDAQVTGPISPALRHVVNIILLQSYQSLPRTDNQPLHCHLSAVDSGAADSDASAAAAASTDSAFSFADYYERLYNHIDALKTRVGSFYRDGNEDDQPWCLALAGMKVELSLTNALDGVQFLHLAVLSRQFNLVCGAVDHMIKTATTACQDIIDVYPPHTMAEKKHIAAALRPHHFIDVYPYRGALAGLTPLLLACLYGYGNQTQRLLDAAANVIAPARSQALPGLTPIIAAIASGDKPTIRALITTAWSDIEAYNVMTEVTMIDGVPLCPLVFAVFSDQPQTVIDCLRIMREQAIPMTIQWPSHANGGTQNAIETIHLLREISKQFNVPQGKAMRRELIILQESIQRALQQAQKKAKKQAKPKSTTAGKKGKSRFAAPKTAPKTASAPRVVAKAKKTKPALPPSPVPSVPVTTTTTTTTTTTPSGGAASANACHLDRLIGEWEQLVLRAEQLQRVIEMHNQSVAAYAHEYTQVYDGRETKHLPTVRLLDATLWNIDIQLAKANQGEAFEAWLGDRLSRLTSHLHTAGHRQSSQQVVLGNYKENLQKAKQRRAVKMNNAVKCTKVAKAAAPRNNTKAPKPTKAVKTAKAAKAVEVAQAIEADSASASTSPSTDTSLPLAATAAAALSVLSPAMSLASSTSSAASVTSQSTTTSDPSLTPSSSEAQSVSTATSTTTSKTTSYASQSTSPLGVSPTDSDDSSASTSNELPEADDPDEALASADTAETTVSQTQTSRRKTMRYQSPPARAGAQSATPTLSYSGQVFTPAQGAGVAPPQSQPQTPQPNMLGSQAVYSHAIHPQQQQHYRPHLQPVPPLQQHPVRQVPPSQQHYQPQPLPPYLQQQPASAASAAMPVARDWASYSLPLMRSLAPLSAAECAELQTMLAQAQAAAAAVAHKTQAREAAQTVAVRAVGIQARSESAHSWRARVLAPVTTTTTTVTSAAPTTMTTTTVPPRSLQATRSQDAQSTRNAQYNRERVRRNRQARYQQPSNGAAHNCAVLFGLKRYEPVQKDGRVATLAPRSYRSYRA